MERPTADRVWFQLKTITLRWCNSEKVSRAQIRRILETNNGLKVVEVATYEIYRWRQWQIILPFHYKADIVIHGIDLLIVAAAKSESKEEEEKVEEDFVAKIFLA